jgi:ElaB/YqjD/DUF883 family membrane-anchored ribosome-binding protein
LVPVFVGLIGNVSHAPKHRNSQHFHREGAMEQHSENIENRTHEHGDVGASRSLPREKGSLDYPGEGGVKNQVRKKARPLLDSGKEQLVVRLSDAAGALRETGEQLKLKNHPRGGEYAATTAEKVDDFTNYLQSKDIGELVDEVQSFVRQRPWFSIASAFMLGMGVARFIKASNRR